MNKITYNYEIVSVDQAARCMEVRYTSPGRAPYHIGARLPYEGESLEGVIAMYAPIGSWREAEVAVIAPSVGSSGTLSNGPDLSDPETIVAQYTAAVNGYVEAVSVARQYSSAAHLASYATSTNPQWAAEAATFIEWRDRVWTSALAMLDQAQTTATPPEPLADFIEKLPKIEWP